MFLGLSKSLLERVKYGRVAENGLEGVLLLWSQLTARLRDNHTRDVIYSLLKVLKVLGTFKRLLKLIFVIYLHLKRVI